MKRFIYKIYMHAYLPFRLNFKGRCRSRIEGSLTRLWSRRNFGSLDYQRSGKKLPRTLVSLVSQTIHWENRTGQAGRQRGREAGEGVGEGGRKAWRKREMMRVKFRKQSLITI